MALLVVFTTMRATRSRDVEHEWVVLSRVSAWGRTADG
jgi:hypothetical protein